MFCGGSENICGHLSTILLKRASIIIVCLTLEQLIKLISLFYINVIRNIKYLHFVTMFSDLNFFPLILFHIPLILFHIPLILFHIPFILFHIPLFFIHCHCTYMSQYCLNFEIKDFFIVIEIYKSISYR